VRAKAQNQTIRLIIYPRYIHIAVGYWSWLVTG